MTSEKEAIITALRGAFSGDEFEENAQAAAGEGEWAWFKWLAVSTVETCVFRPVPSEAPMPDAATAAGPARFYEGGEGRNAQIAAKMSAMSADGRNNFRAYLLGALICYVDDATLDGCLRHAFEFVERCYR